jgi:hypothetical protein
MGLKPRRCRNTWNPLALRSLSMESIHSSDMPGPATRGRGSRREHTADVGRTRHHCKCSKSKMLCKVPSGTFSSPSIQLGGFQSGVSSHAVFCHYSTSAQPALCEVSSCAVFCHYSRSPHLLCEAPPPVEQTWNRQCYMLTAFTDAQWIEHSCYR